MSVTQADREAAADLWAKFPNMKWTEWQEGWMRDGAGDAGPLVQAFAAHRKAAIEQCAAWHDEQALQYFARSADCAENAPVSSHDYCNRGRLHEAYAEELRALTEGGDND